MDTRASLSILLLLFGVSQASPLMEERFEGVFVSEPEPLDITTRILESNNGSSEVLIEGDLVFPKTRNALNCFNNHCFWKKNSNNIVEIPYIVSGEFSYNNKLVIANAMFTFHSKTCIRFVARSTQSDYISIENKDGCYSSLGRTGGKQVVSLNRQGCVHHGIFQHELNHALGFYHDFRYPVGPLPDYDSGWCADLVLYDGSSARGLAEHIPELTDQGLELHLLGRRQLWFHEQLAAEPTF
ncbi:high choriolytic enzyme 2-like [Sinocyclocheilus grahami]|uniref:high choriolytic enzyme 2-like n=1 Tax=Sinocyclocheilus grahami TaxID=75366 RepID=UPI0007ACF1D9|nr:PREDICTED: high choriolytic enzyme 2-like [Sinocyclocheilus grahami]